MQLVMKHSVGLIGGSPDDCSCASGCTALVRRIRGGRCQDKGPACHQPRPLHGWQCDPLVAVISSLVFCNGLIQFTNDSVLLLREVYFDVEIGGEAAGRIIMGLSRSVSYVSRT